MFNKLLSKEVIRCTPLLNLSIIRLSVDNVLISFKNFYFVTSLIKNSRLYSF